MGKEVIIMEKFLEFLKEVLKGITRAVSGHVFEQSVPVHHTIHTLFRQFYNVFKFPFKLLGLTPNLHTIKLTAVK